MEKFNIKKTKNYNLMLRIISGLILGPLVIYITLKGGVLFNMFVIFIAILMSFEWAALINLKPNELLDIDSSKSSSIWKICGIIYILLPTISLIWIRELENGEKIVIWLLMVVWATDVFAFFTGKAFGGPKLAPKISPKKTWSGLIGGIIAAAMVGYGYSFFTKSEQYVFLVIVSATLAIYAQIGDLVESWVKRRFNVKDSGNLIPGHGGVLDRVDGIVAVAPKVVLIILIDNYGIF